MENPVLDAIKRRRNIMRFDSTPIEEEKIQALLEAGRWAPSWANKQPWKFIVVRDKALKEKCSTSSPTIFTKGIKEAPVCIVIVVDTQADPYHYTEDGAAAVQNIALAAHSLGLCTGWIGIIDINNNPDSAENKVKQILKVPDSYRVVAIIPVGYTSGGFPEPKRKPLNEIVFQDKFSS